MDSDSWGKERKQLIEVVFALFCVAVIIIVVIATLYRAPSCTDGKQNEHELGIDCGGPCPYLCTGDETAPSARFIRAISPQPGRTDIIAYIDNSNSDAQLVNAPVTVDLYDRNQSLLATEKGTVTVPPSTTEPLFLPGFYVGSKIPSQAFITFTSTTTMPWVKAIKPAALPATNIQIQNGAEPKISATVSNPTTVPFQNVKVVVTVFDASDKVVGASQTIIDTLPAEGSVPVIFTWNEPFPTLGVRAEILRAF